MERILGELFEYNGKQITVSLPDITGSCEGCVLLENCLTNDNKDIFGDCLSDYRTDGNDIIFKESQIIKKWKV